VRYLAPSNSSLHPVKEERGLSRFQDKLSIAAPTTTPHPITKQKDPATPNSETRPRKIQTKRRLTGGFLVWADFGGGWVPKSDSPGLGAAWNYKFFGANMRRTDGI